jgi:hypothetical protein
VTVSSALTAIAGVVAGVSGIRSAPANPTEQANADPYAAIYVSGGQVNAGVIGSKYALMTVAIDVLKVRKDLPRDLATLTPFLDTVPAALLAEVSSGGDMFSGNIVTFGSVQIEFLPDVNYAGVDMIGYRFIMTDVKFLTAL